MALRALSLDCAQGFALQFLPNPEYTRPKSLRILEPVMRLKQFRLTFLPMLGGGVLILFAVLATAQTRNTAAVALTEADLHFPGTFSSDLPYDVNPAKLAAALADDLKTASAQPPSEEMRVPKSQRLFDIFAWQAFLALNWPADASGNPERA